MLSLKSPRWCELKHAYGFAGDVPALLERLREFPSSVGESEPWFTIWSALAHQGDVYSASFAAVPHVISAFAVDPARADSAYLHFPAWVEICRAKNRVEVPLDLSGFYFESLARIPHLVAQTASRPWDPGFTACALSAVAAAKGHHAVAEAVLEMTEPEAATGFIEWWSNL